MPAGVLPQPAGHPRVERHRLGHRTLIMLLHSPFGWHPPPRGAGRECDRLPSPGWDAHGGMQPDHQRFTFDSIAIHSARAALSFLCRSRIDHRRGPSNSRWRTALLSSLSLTDEHAPPVSRPEHLTAGSRSLPDRTFGCTRRQPARQPPPIGSFEPFNPPPVPKSNSTTPMRRRRVHSARPDSRPLRFN